MPDPPVRPNFLQSLNVISQFRSDVLSEGLARFSSLPIPLFVQKPVGHLEGPGVLYDSDELFDFVGRQVTSPLRVIDLGLFADEIREPAAYAGHFGQGVHHFDSPIDVRVQNTQNVLEIGA
eukprot:CAMPEP_0171457254 /NCGR_PEP_ID=MMETSP0945-20130129/3407_1 /TAXON_ID=109269 /ORGANISM="Vaucheria litorea, Strain CCMP2940" /LENGTH=120 /DNA_ID=CAMNT_0011982827 /DNA_START=142 /DNA_END=504 /DNA_ORIENTATION=+